MKRVSVEIAVGLLLAHDLTKIVPDIFNEVVMEKKGGLQLFKS